MLVPGLIIAGGVALLAALWIGFDLGRTRPAWSIAGAGVAAIVLGVLVLAFDDGSSLPEPLDRPPDATLVGLPAGTDLGQMEDLVTQACVLGPEADPALVRLATGAAAALGTVASKYPGGEWTQPAYWRNDEEAVYVPERHLSAAQLLRDLSAATAGLCPTPVQRALDRSLDRLS